MESSCETVSGIVCIGGRTEAGIDCGQDESSEDSWVPSLAQTVHASDRFPVRMFNQGQIAELAGEQSTGIVTGH